MDERDFAELISVFLKGAEGEKAAREKEEGTPVPSDEEPKSESEIRRNIIEALAEKIKETQEPQEQETSPEKLGEPTVSQTPAESPGGQVFEEAERPAEEQLITKEEVDKLLNKEESREPAEIVPLQQILYRFLSLDGVSAAILATRDGFTVDYASSEELEFDMISATIATCFNYLEKVGNELDRGLLDIAMLEYEHGPVIIAPLVHDVWLAIVASNWTTLGRIRWEIKKYAGELIAHL